MAPSQTPRRDDAPDAQQRRIGADVKRIEAELRVLQLRTTQLRALAQLLARDDGRTEAIHQELVGWCVERLESDIRRKSAELHEIEAERAAVRRKPASESARVWELRYVFLQTLFAIHPELLKELRALAPVIAEESKDAAGRLRRTQELQGWCVDAWLLSGPEGNKGGVEGNGQGLSGRNGPTAEVWPLLWARSAALRLARNARLPPEDLLATPWSQVPMRYRGSTLWRLDDPARSERSGDGGGRAAVAHSEKDQRACRWLVMFLAGECYDSIARTSGLSASAVEKATVKLARRLRLNVPDRRGKRPKAGKP